MSDSKLVGKKLAINGKILERDKDNPKVIKKLNLNQYLF